MKSEFTAGLRIKIGIIVAFFAATGSGLHLAAQDIDFSGYYTDGWQVLGSTIGYAIDSAPKTSASTGITFLDWNGEFVSVGAEYPGPQNSPSLATITFEHPAALPDDPAVNALFNTIYGVPGEVNAIVTFTNSKGETASFSLVGNQTIRDFSSSAVATSLQGFNTDSSLGGVTTQNWWNDASTGGTDSLDVSTFYLPGSWTGTNLVSVAIEDPFSTSSLTDDVALSALQVASVAPLSVPEPAGAGLLVLGLLGLGLGWNLTRRSLVG